jgi:hypothetical protein
VSCLSVRNLPCGAQKLHRVEQIQSWCILRPPECAAGLKPGSIFNKAPGNAALKRGTTKAARGYSNSEIALALGASGTRLKLISQIAFGQSRFVGNQVSRRLELQNQVPALSDLAGQLGKPVESVLRSALAAQSSHRAVQDYLLAPAVSITFTLRAGYVFLSYSEWDARQATGRTPSKA